MAKSRHGGREMGLMPRRLALVRPLSRHGHTGYVSLTRTTVTAAPVALLCFSMGVLVLIRSSDKAVGGVGISR